MDVPTQPILPVAATPHNPRLQHLSLAGLTLRRSGPVERAATRHLSVESAHVDLIGRIKQTDDGKNIFRCTIENIVALQGVDRILSDESRGFAVARAGFYTTREASGHIMIRGMGVDPAFRHRGLMRTFLAFEMHLMGEQEPDVVFDAYVRVGVHGVNQSAYMTFLSLLFDNCDTNRFKSSADDPDINDGEADPGHYRACLMRTTSGWRERVRAVVLKSGWLP
ncbi:GNAT superfamily N-acetyltransferase [Rhodopseudomonas rhenobacensis]|uniref:GNAT superfamily N-acetyltransferase n=1 Tax=Rhodopseudomonas rhenobacensis TaxID=87461 RepID=A0A7W7Z5S4_9BRAD|nr:hypothetical protein [Rhodopseudomonas rhenobacensis]MBB5048533.1 GNAT superfamily N-acetyltransferase [Rhodopseudomonas rhenobacensis]